MAKTKKEEQVVSQESETNVTETQVKKRKKDKKDKSEKKSKRKSKKTETKEEVVSEEVVSEEVKTTEKPSESVSSQENETEPLDVSEETSKSDSSECQFNDNREKTDELLKTLIESVQERIASDKVLLSNLREFNRHLVRERKEVEKIVKKMSKGQGKKRRGGNKSPGGFTKPAPLSVQMCSFLEVPEGTELPRTEVTRRVNMYVKSNNLQNPENKKQILPDRKLGSLLYLSDTDELTYFNLQRYMKVHFLKKDPESGEISPFTPPVVS